MLLAGVIQTDGISVEFVSGGITEKVGGYRPIRVVLEKSADDLKVEPEGLIAPKYGELEMGGNKWMVIVDEPEDGDPRVFVDANGDGDLTNDPETEWEVRTQGGTKMFQGKTEVDLGDGKLGTLRMYRFDPTDERRAAVADSIFFYADYGYQVTVTLDEKEYKSFVAGELTNNMRLAIDRDGNGRISSKRETVMVGKPFNFTGTTMVIALNDGKLSLDKADEELPITPLPPDTSLGKLAIPFSGTTMEGTEIKFPESFDGKIVMLDFWATWCGPCVAEIPHMKKAYADWHEHGFEILGISFDRPEMEEKILEFLEDREMPWPQIYEGKFWDTSYGELYDVSGIPFVLLVDGSTGEILGTSRELRGRGLSRYLGKIMKERKGITQEFQSAEDEESDKEEGDK
jgi:thiol-disulfide isomerase/thioredoxin